MDLFDDHLRQLHDSYVPFFVERRRIEEIYIESLTKLLKKITAIDSFLDDRNPLSTTRAAWAEVRDSLERETQSRLAFLATLSTDILGPLAALRDAQDRSRKRIKEDLKDSLAAYSDYAENTLSKLKQRYLRKFADVQEYKRPAAPTDSKPSVTAPQPLRPLDRRPSGSASGHAARARSPSSSMAFSDLAQQGKKQLNNLIGGFLDKSSALAKSNSMKDYPLPLNSPGTPVPGGGNTALRTVKAKRELEEADREYRNGVHWLETLRLRRVKIVEAAHTSLESFVDEGAQVLKRVCSKYADNLLATTSTQTQLYAHLRDIIDARISPAKDLIRLASVLRHRPPDKDSAVPERILYEHAQVGPCKDLLFGFSLVDYAVAKSLLDGAIPKIVRICIQEIDARGLESDGIYRVSGRYALVQNLQHEIEKDEDKFEFINRHPKDDIYVVASLLKQYLRELPEPLFKFPLHERLQLYNSHNQLPGTPGRASTPAPSTSDRLSSSYPSSRPSTSSSYAPPRSNPTSPHQLVASLPPDTHPISSTDDTQVLSHAQPSDLDSLSTHDTPSQTTVTATNPLPPSSPFPLPLPLLHSKLRRLPPIHYHILRVLLEHLARVAAHSDRNRMDAKNLGIVWRSVVFGEDDVGSYGHGHGVPGTPAIGVGASGGINIPGSANPVGGGFNIGSPPPSAGLGFLSSDDGGGGANGAGNRAGELLLEMASWKDTLMEDMIMNVGLLFGGGGVEEEKEREKAGEKEKAKGEKVPDKDKEGEKDKDKDKELEAPLPPTPTVEPAPVEYGSRTTRVTNVPPPPSSTAPIAPPSPKPKHVHVHGHVKTHSRSHSQGQGYGHGHSGSQGHSRSQSQTQAQVQPQGSGQGDSPRPSSEPKSQSKPSEGQASFSTVEITPTPSTTVSSPTPVPTPNAAPPLTPPPTATSSSSTTSPAVTTPSLTSPNAETEDFTPKLPLKPAGSIHPSARAGSGSGGGHEEEDVPPPLPLRPRMRAEGSKEEGKTVDGSDIKPDW